MKRLYFFIVFVGSLIFLSCDSSDENPALSDADYFPLQTGVYQIYDVEETVYELGVPTTKEYQLKTMVTDSFTNTAGTITYVISRSRRNSDELPWTTEETWGARVSPQELIRTEGTTPFVILQFPVYEGLSWNANAYNSEEDPENGISEDLYSILSHKTPYSTGALTFNDCVTVEQENNEEFIVYHDERRETFARGVGLVLKELTQLHYCNDADRGCIGQQIIDEGIIYKQVIVEYGRE